MTRPTNALVAVSWLSQRVAGLTSAMVATKLPRETSAWAANGFVQVTIVPGAPDVEIPLRKPIVQVDCWAVTLDASGAVSTKPPVGKANNLAELIFAATYDGQTYGRNLDIPLAGYDDARVLSVVAITEPAEVTDDLSGYARVTLDLMMHWAPA